MLGRRLLIQCQGFDSSSSEELSMYKLQVIERNDPHISVDIYDDVSDVDGPIPGSSTTPGILTTRRESNPLSRFSYSTRRPSVSLKNLQN
ncbi:hypothetical protein FQA39_LY13052 [Lamprigera yunnana]|nr:hypothetical protein FQA39_LY13052 [Lamprigera yunnana]